jgi:3'-phosphoadenosine 5'-phosphosulfate (PAPS) 3'-phosphatase
MWDTCAPEIILFEGGGSLTDLDNNRLDYSRTGALNDMAYVASNGACQALVVDACRRVLQRR